jgi:predicted transcriptional regulator
MHNNKYIFYCIGLYMKITGGYLLAITGAKLRKLRTQAGLTQKKLAELVGVSQAHVAKIERGNVDPRLSTINKILNVLLRVEQKKCGDIMTRKVISAKPNDSILKISEAMIRHAVSQMPVMSGKKVVGTITEETIIRNLRANLAEEKAKNVMDPPLPMVQEDASLDIIRSLLEKNPGILIEKNKEVVGIITRSDLLKTIG